MERGPEKNAEEKDKAQGKKAENKTETVASSEKQQNRSIWFLQELVWEKLDNPVWHFVFDHFRMKIREG
jgi:hypothetical protein